MNKIKATISVIILAVNISAAQTTTYRYASECSHLREENEHYGNGDGENISWCAMSKPTPYTNCLCEVERNNAQFENEQKAISDKFNSDLSDLRKQRDIAIALGESGKHEEALSVLKKKILPLTQNLETYGKRTYEETKIKELNSTHHAISRIENLIQTSKDKSDNTANPNKTQDNELLNGSQNQSNSQFQDPWAIGERNEAFFDPMEVFKSEGTDLFRQMANETGNKQIEKVANNLETVRGYALAFKAATPDHMEAISKLENYSMLVALIAPFIFEQSDKPDEAQLRQNDLANIREHDARIKAFEKSLMVEVLTVKEQLFKYYNQGESEKFAKYYKAYLSLLNTPVVMYNPEGLMFNFYSDIDRNNSWESNMRNNPMSPSLEEKLKSYNLNTTIGEIYYGSGKSISSKKILDALFYMSINPNTKKEDILGLLKKYPLYEQDFRMFDYQPYLFALNYAHNSNKPELFEEVWRQIDRGYQKLSNKLENIQVSDNRVEQRKHLKSIGYPIVGVPSKGEKNLVDAKNGLMHSMSYSILKRRYDLLKETNIDAKYDFNNILIAYSAFDIEKNVLAHLGYLLLSETEEAYLLQMMMENLFGVQEEGIRTDDKKLFLSVMRKGMKISQKYTKLTNGEAAKEKNNYFKPTYHNEVNVIFISTYDYIKNAKGYATLANALGGYFCFDNKYINPAFLQDAKLINARINWYNAWAHYYRTGEKSQINAYKTNYKNNAYAILEWLISYGTAIK